MGGGEWQSWEGYLKRELAQGVQISQGVQILGGGGGGGPLRPGKGIFAAYRGFSRASRGAVPDPQGGFLCLQAGIGLPGTYEAGSRQRWTALQEGTDHREVPVAVGEVAPHVDHEDRLENHRLPLATGPRAAYG